MTTVEDFKVKSHELLVELDTATSEMMALICVHQMSGRPGTRLSGVNTRPMNNGSPTSTSACSCTIVNSNSKTDSLNGPGAVMPNP